MSVISSEELANDIIKFFKTVGATDELSDRGFDNSEIMTAEYGNYIIDTGKKYGLYDENKEAKDVNYVLNLEDELVELFKDKLINAFNSD